MISVGLFLFLTAKLDKQLCSLNNTVYKISYFLAHHVTETKFVSDDECDFSVATKE